jgi:UrcA family protein
MLHPKFASTLASLIALTAVAAVTPASAGTADAATIITNRVVKFQDLDLRKPADARNLYRRIRRAAIQVCQPNATDPFDLDCYQLAIAAAVARVNQPLVSALLPRSGASARPGA